MPRAFILKASEGRTAPDFSLKSLAGSPGRMDLISRCMIAAFNTPRGLRRDAILEVVLEGMPNPPVSVTMEGGAMDRPPGGEPEAAAMIRDALSGTPAGGFTPRRRSFQDSVRHYAAGGFRLYYLHEEGRDLRAVSLAERPAFILGDHKGLDPSSERFVDSMGAERVGLGPHSYLASHCITLVNCELDMVNR